MNNVTLKKARVNAKTSYMSVNVKVSLGLKKKKKKKHKLNSNKAKCKLIMIVCKRKFLNLPLSSPCVR